MKPQLNNRNVKLPILIIVFLSSIFYTEIVLGSHIRSAEINVRKISSTELKYQFKLTALRDSDPGVVNFGFGEFVFGDGIVVNSLRGAFQNRERDENGDLIVPSFEVTDLGNGVELNVFIIEHTYNSFSNEIIVSYQEEFRNAGIINIDNSENTSFYVESQFGITPFLSENSSPILTVPPIDRGGQFIKFSHNPGALDPDGDSLVFKFITPKQGVETDVPGYRSLTDRAFYNNFENGDENQQSPPKLSIDAENGTIVWDAPDAVGEYNIAFIVEEWRMINGMARKIGFITRDMQIIVEPTSNHRPLLTIPRDICVEAGTEIEEVIIGNDIDNHNLLIEVFGGPFELTPIQFQEQPASVQFSWRPDCEFVRDRSYNVVVKVTDQPETGSALVTLENWQITVVAPPPTGLESTKISEESIELNWDSYSCPESDRMQIWRKINGFTYSQSNCELGLPENSGYELIDVVDIAQTNYVDDNDGGGLAPGANYCYRLVAQNSRFSDVNESLTSNEICEKTNVFAPVITNVDVIETSIDSGEITVKWTSPFDLLREVNDFNYRLYRRTEDSIFELVNEGTDTVFIDTELNTENFIYEYQIVSESLNTNLVDSSEIASSVRLVLAPLFDAINLNWESNVPWSNQSQEYPYHYIYRDHVSDNENELVLIDSVNVLVDTFFYQDNGRFNGENLDDNIEYCYAITTQGVYGNANIQEPLLNNSQIFCVSPDDNLPPCTPLAVTFQNDIDCQDFFIDKSCHFSDFVNSISWELDESNGCDEDIKSFNIYFSMNGDEDEFELIANIKDPYFDHNDLTSFKGCYKISSIDGADNESALSEPICRDNCPSFKIPNAFTPNNDGVNDYFVPFSVDEDNSSLDQSLNCPRFVEKVTISIVNRTGREVYFYDSESSQDGIEFFSWDGKSKNNDQLPVGLYYYSAKVNFDVMEETARIKEYKGWIQLIR